MIVLCATNRPEANSRRVAARVMQLAQQLIEQQQVEQKQGSTTNSPELKSLDLADLKSDIFEPTVYEKKPDWFIEGFQKPILAASGLIVVVPEYNGSFPGVMKYFVDMLQFPESLRGLPVAFIGCAAGQFGAMRSVEQLTHIFQYRSAHVYGARLFIPGIASVLEEDGTLGAYEERLSALLKGFIGFSQAIAG